jgi:hypothetical protein
LTETYIPTKSRAFINPNPFFNLNLNLKEINLLSISIYKPTVDGAVVTATDSGSKG